MMKIEVQPEDTSEIALTTIVDTTAEFVYNNIIKKEFSCFGPNSLVQEHAVVKHEDTGMQSLNLQIKSEVSDLKCGIESYTDNIDIKLEQVVGEEFYIKNEVEENLVDQSIEKSIQIENFYCDLCNCKFASKKSLRQHLNIHTGEKPFKCNMCDYKCARNFTLQQHMKKHTGEKPFQCFACNYRCIWNSNLQLHMKSHTREKPFQCNTCDYKCVQKRTLQQHMKMHTGEKLFQCSVCNYSCIWKCNLKQHMRTHTGEKPFQCSICGYKCIQKNRLQVHMKTHS